TDPPAGSAVPRDQPVDVVVTESAPSLIAPSVTGLLRSSAAEALADSPLVISYRNQTVAFDDSRSGRVIAQSIPAGTPVSPGMQLQLTVAVAAAPPTTTTVPGATTTTAP
ncbi:MAG TPA: PASTA domain-containing protein, partial [Microthrixaceae bacterium]|nr:PASTA domain-containing protein [Microthrixaceae bacterium]